MRLLKNVATGNAVEENNDGEAQAVPQAVSMAQARKALLHGGLLDAVDSAIGAIADEAARQRAAIDWEYATEVRRDSADLPLLFGLFQRLEFDRRCRAILDLLHFIVALPAVLAAPA